MRSEFSTVETAFDKLPTMSGNGGEIVAVNSGATALEAITTTGTGSGVRATSPTLVTPTLGVAAVTSINKVSITAPATSATLTIADGKTLVASNSLTFTGTDGSTLAIGTGGTLGTGAYATIADYATLASPTFTGTVTVDVLNATGGGSLTGTWSNLGTVTTVDINGGTVDGAVIGGSSAAAGTFTSLNASGGGALTGTWTNLGTVTTIDINGGTVDGAVIGGASPAAITGTTITDSKGEVRRIVQNAKTGAYELVLTDAGKHISITTGGITIPANASVAFVIGDAVTVYNNSGSSQTIAITSDALRQAGTASTGSRTLAQYGIATLLKVDTTTWIITGAGIT
jgi:hypothetical protein